MGIINHFRDDFSYHEDAKIGADRPNVADAMKALLPQLDEALESLEIHGRHSDQGYRRLREWYRKMAKLTDEYDRATNTQRCMACDGYHPSSNLPCPKMKPYSGS